MKPCGMKPGDKRNGLRLVESWQENVGTQKVTVGHFECDCGRETRSRVAWVNRGVVKSCGCLRDEKASGRFLAMFQTHGLSNHPLMSVRSNMIQRCENPNNSHYPSYGGRGIRVCEAWRVSYLAFYEWSMANGWEAGLTIDRVDNDGDYHPGNCRWADDATQRANKRTSHFLAAFGERKTIKQWSLDPRAAVGSRIIRQRVVRLGWDAERAISTPLVQPLERGRCQKNNRRVAIYDETKTVAEWARDPRCRVNEITFRSRLREGWDEMAALTKPAAPTRPC